MDLKDWISEKDLDIKEFTEQFIEVVKDEYGRHNFKQVLDTVNNEFSNSVSDPVKEAYKKGFNDGASAAADVIEANLKRL